MSDWGGRRFSQAISEGDGISVIVEIDGAGAARAAAADGAEAVVARSGSRLEEPVELPLLWIGGVDDAARVGADACIVVASELDDEDGGRLDEAFRQATEHGLDCVVSVADDDELVRVLERHEPDIFLLGGGFDGALELLSDVPVGKLAIAWIDTVTREQVAELERAGVDAVIVPAHNVAELVGDRPSTV